MQGKNEAESKKEGKTDRLKGRRKTKGWNLGRVQKWLCRTLEWPMRKLEVTRCEKEIVRNTVGEKKD